MTKTRYILLEVVTKETSCDDDYYDQEYEIKNTIAHSNNKEELETEAENLNQKYQKINEKLSEINKYIEKYNADFRIQFSEVRSNIVFDESQLLTKPDFIPHTAQEHKQRKEIKDYNEKIKRDFEGFKRNKEINFVNNYKLQNPISEKLKGIVKFVKEGRYIGMSYGILYLAINTKKLTYVVEEFAKSYVENTCEKLQSIWND
jgi:hypothetical protein